MAINSDGANSSLGSIPWGVVSLLAATLLAYVAVVEIVPASKTWQAAQTGNGFVVIPTAKNDAFVKPLFLSANKATKLLHAALADPYQCNLLIGMGVQKGGTTTLFQYLANASFISPPTIGKELHFFDRMNFETVGPSAQAEYFDKFGKDRPVKMEVTPIYIYSREAASSIVRVLGPQQLAATRFLLFLRNAAKRTFSATFHEQPTLPLAKFPAETMDVLLRTQACYNSAYALGPPGLDLATATADSFLVLNISSKQLSRLEARPADADLKVLSICVDPVKQIQQYARCSMEAIGTKRLKQKASAIERGLYVDQLRHWLCAGIQPQQILIATTSDWQTPQVTVHRIASWLGRGDSYTTPRLEEAFNADIHRASRANGRPYPEAIMTTLRTYFKPYDNALLELLNDLPFDVNITTVAAEFQQTTSQPLQ
eukprot:m.164811 g.164811  ORF g.164811 m.164811 type:complete len:428 (-) comp16587_c0_seq9:1941-3224(-)